MNKIVMIKKVFILIFCIFSLQSHSTIAQKLIIEIEIKDHFFVPDKIEIPADTKVKLIVYNRDKTPEEFESYELNREKVIMGKRKANIFIGPLTVGEYPFFGEFNQKTAQGLIIVK